MTDKKKDPGNLFLDSHRPPAADACHMALSGRSPSTHFKIVTTVPSVPLTPCAHAPRPLDALATKLTEKCGPELPT